MSETETETRKAPALRLVTINSDQSPVLGPTRVVTLLNPDTLRPLAGVTVTLRVLGREACEAIDLKHRVPDKSSGRVEMKVDQKAAMLEVLFEAVVSWQGIVGADNKPLPVVGATLKALDQYNQAHLAGAARTPSEIVELDAEVVEASFRESAGVAGVAG